MSDHPYGEFMHWLRNEIALVSLQQQLDADGSKAAEAVEARRIEEIGRRIASSDLPVEAQQLLSEFHALDEQISQRLQRHAERVGRASGLSDALEKMRELRGELDPPGD